MKTLALLTMALALAGCTTLSNVGKMNRLIPQIEHLVLLKDKAVDGQGQQKIVVCGEDAYEKKLTVAIAKQMGWKVSVEELSKHSGCSELTFTK